MNRILILHFLCLLRPPLPLPTVSRIHVEDLCRVVAAAMARQHVSGAACTWNVADNEPASRSEVLAFAAGLLGLGEVTDPGRSSVRQQRAQAEHKRVANLRVKRDLGVELRFPSFREGLRGLYELEQEREREGQKRVQKQGDQNFFEAR